MDFADIDAGNKPGSFWFRSKINLLDILLRRGSAKGKILSIGTGTGDELKAIEKYGKAYAIDKDEKALKYIRCDNKKKGDICSIPFNRCFFDVVVCMDVLEHVNDDKKAVREIYRVLKEGGLFIASVPAFKALFSGHDRALKHKRRYSKSRFLELLKEFKYSRIYWWNSLLLVPVALKRVLFRKNKVDNMNTSFDKMLGGIISLDNFLIKNNLSMPAGLSLVGVCKK